MPGQDLAFDGVGFRPVEEDTGRIVWIFRRHATKNIRGLFYDVEPHGDLELAQLWEKHSLRYAEAISQAWEAGDEDRLDVIAEEIEDAIEEEIGSAPDSEEDSPAQDNEDSSPAGDSSAGDGGGGGTDKA